MTYQIKPLTPQDWEIYKEIRLETLLEEPYAFSNLYEDALKYPDSKWQEIIKDSQSTYLSICSDNKVIGIGRITFNDPEEPAGTAYIGGIYINKVHRGQGLGKKLLKELMHIATTNQEVKTIKLEVKEKQLPAINLYKSLGFENVGKKEDELVMLKNIG